MKIPREDMRSLPRLVGRRVPSRLPCPDGGTGARQGANHRRSRGLLVLGEGDFLEDNRRADHSISRYWRGSRSKRAILVGDHTVV